MKPLSLKDNAASQRPHNPDGSFPGVDWTHSTLRPGCQDHLKVPSRRADRDGQPVRVLAGGHPITCASALHPYIHQRR